MRRQYRRPTPPSPVALGRRPAVVVPKAGDVLGEGAALAVVNAADGHLAGGHVAAVHVQCFEDLIEEFLFDYLSS